MQADPASCAIVLAGGLHPGNVADAVRAVRPWAVDVSSGVEDAPGIKSVGKIRQLMAAIKSVDQVAR
ncbi:N-(5'-phosphoribosyl)anthranilate isomerase [Bordetella pertussis]|nr:N-(5'-phosphoribosyl)anthranilate isomerase [Bordetella pertussis]